MNKIQATCAIILNSDNQLLLIKRRKEPFANHWALVSGIGFTKQGLSPAEAVLGEVKSDINSVFSGTEIFRMPVSDDDIISETVVFMGSINEQTININQTDVMDFRWVSLGDIDSLGQLAYEHNEIINRCIEEKIIT